MSDATLSMGLLPWYVLFAVALYLVTRRCGGPLAGAIAAWLLAFAPPYVQYQQIMPRGDYPETLAFGTILLWLALRVTHDDLAPAVERKCLLAIAFVAGLAFWTNWLVFPYFAVVGVYLLLHDWRLPIRPVMLPMGAALRLPEFGDPASPALAERRLRLQSAREPESDGPLVELRRLYRSLGEWEKLREIERIEAERFRPAVRVDWRFGRDLRLLGYGWRALGPRRVEITYYWQAMRTMDEDYAAYLRLRGDGRLLKDDHLPKALHTTKRWLPEEIVKDVRQISIPADFPNASYEATIGVWVPRNKRHVRLGRFGVVGGADRAALSAGRRG